MTGHAPEVAVTSLGARAAFDQQMARLIALRFPPAGLDPHWEALQDIPLVVLTAAVSLAQRSRADFPTPYELRQDADQVSRQVVAHAPEPEREVALAEPLEFQVPHVAHPLRVTKYWRYDCEDCSDLGWRTYACGETSPKPWVPRRLCQRRHAHGPHEFAEVCVCVETNPTLRRRREASSQYAARRATR